MAQQQQQQQQSAAVVPPPPFVAAPPHFHYGYVPQPYPFVAAPPPQVLQPTTMQAFFAPWEPPPPPVPPPADGELQKRIDKLAEYAAKNGPDFEALMKEKQKENAAYAFLFGAEGHGYYRYKLWSTLNPFIQPFNPAMGMISPALGLPAGLNVPLAQPAGAFPAFPLQTPAPPAPPSSSTIHQPAFVEHGNSRGNFPANSEVLGEWRERLDRLAGTKDCIQDSTTWFMQRCGLAPALAEALQERVIGWDKLDRQMHALHLVSEVLFSSLQHRASLKELDAEALAFLPVLGSILRAIYRNAQNVEAERENVESMLQSWGENEVFDWETINSFEKDMRAGSVSKSDPLPTPSSTTGEVVASPEKQPNHGFFPATIQLNLSSTFSSVTAPGNALQPAPASAPKAGSEQAAYPHFPPGLIPGMVRKMQIGSGVPYSPLSPLDIPSVIPPPSSSESYILERVSKFFKEIGEADPLAGNSESEEEREEERSGARIPPPAEMQYDPETGTLADGSVEHRAGVSSSGRLGLGAAADPNEASQYDDVYTSYRKQRSTNYHTSLSARAGALR